MESFFVWIFKYYKTNATTVLYKIKHNHGNTNWLITSVRVIESTSRSPRKQRFAWRNLSMCGMLSTRKNIFLYFLCTLIFIRTCSILPVFSPSIASRFEGFILIKQVCILARNEGWTLKSERPCRKLLAWLFLQELAELRDHRWRRTGRVQEPK